VSLPISLKEVQNAQKIAGDTKAAEEIESRIKGINDKINKQNAAGDEDSSFSVFS
jgi:diadenosine tetraphosphate (Ap4A) HIT family hydrolase